MKLRVLGLLVVGLAGLYGCATTQQTPAETPPAEEKPAEPAAGAETKPAEPAAELKVNPLEDPSSPLYKKVFYFPFDSAEVSAADRDVLAAHAAFLSTNVNVKVTVEGHADERGSREYNLALGERRAQAVQRLLSAQGAGKSQGKTVTYGEERPVANCHDESCWGQNRRVELLYSGY